MADTFYPLTELVKINNRNLAPFEASEILNRAPLLRRMASIEASKGTDHEVICETTEPTSGFRAANDGIENDISGDTVDTINCKILDSSFAIDKALADGYTKGRDALLEREGMRHLRSAFFLAEKQVIYGTGVDSAGFAGIGNHADFDGLADSQVLGAGGSSACTSVYLIQTNPEALAFVMGNGGNIQVDDFVVQRIAGSATGTYPAYYVPIVGYAALQIPSKYQAVRIANIDDGSNTLTDDLIAQGLELCPDGFWPDLMVMSRRSRRQLQNSRTATNGTGSPAPFPVEAFGVDIIVSEAISNSETAVT